MKVDALLSVVKRPRDDLNQNAVKVGKIEIRAGKIEIRHGETEGLKAEMQCTLLLINSRTTLEMGALECNVSADPCPPAYVLRDAA